MKRFVNLTATLLLAGSVFLWSGCSAGGRVAADVTIDGVAVGRLTYAEAEGAVRRHIAESLPPLTIHTPAGDFTVRYPELSFTDNASVLVRSARRGEALDCSYTRHWADAEARLEALCAENVREAVDAQMSFSNEGFVYTAEQNGFSCDYAGLLADVTAALKGEETDVALSGKEYAPAVTEQSLKEKHVLLSEFTTYFDGSNTPRVGNIRLSSERIGGTVLQPNEEFSFNGTVGKRTEENGYGTATVIQDGQFAQGVGGGVCQTSTTLFNAALLAGMKITESRNHSLSISYVPPSLDAMVSDYSDLKFVNPYEYPVYVISRVEGESVTFAFYGAPTGIRYETESVVIMRNPPPPPQIVEGEEEKLIRAEKEGMVSESYLLSYDKEDNLLSRTRIRRDSYATVQGIWQTVFE